MIKVSQIQTKTYVTASKLPAADYVINPYIGCPHKCIYCYAEFMKRFTNHNSDEWGDFLDVKLCSAPIKFDKINNASILFSSVTDAYNPYEKKYKITRKILGEFADNQFEGKIEILTKSDLVTRDIDLLKKIPNIRVGISMNSLSDGFCKKTEPFASSPTKRVKAMQTLYESGISTYLFMSPIFPGITQFSEVVEKVQPFADSFYFENLNLRAGYFPRILNFIAENFPEQMDLFDSIYRKKDISYWIELSKEIDAYCQQAGLDYKLYFFHQKIKKGGKGNDYIELLEKLK